MTTSTAPAKLISRDAPGIACRLFCGTGVAFAWFIFGETFIPLHWVGFAVVLAALIVFEKLARGNR